MTWERFSRSWWRRRSNRRTWCTWWRVCGSRWDEGWCIRCWMERRAARAGARAGARERSAAYVRSAGSRLAAGGWGAAGGNASDFLRRLVESVKRLTGGASTAALPVLLCPSPARYHVRRWLEPFLPQGDGVGAGRDSAGDSGTKCRNGRLKLDWLNAGRRKCRRGQGEKS